MENSYKATRVWGQALHAVLGSFLSSYNIGLFTSSQPCVAASLGWGDDKDLIIAVCSSLVPLGAMFGAISAGPISNRIGRRKNLILGDLIIIIASLVTIIPTTYTFASGRFISGIGIGTFTMLCPVYINEVTPVNVNGKVGSLVQLFGCLGALFAFGFALFLPTGNYDHDPMNNFWIAMFLFQGLVALIQLLIFFVTFKHETPYWLVSKGHSPKALESLKSVYHENAEKILKNIENYSFLQTADLQKSPDLVVGENEFCTARIKKIMRIGIFINVFQQFAGINAILSYATTIFGKFGGGVFMSRLFTFFSGIVKVIAVFGILPFIDTVGRKKILIVGCIGMSVCLGMMGFLSGILQENMFIPFVFIELYLMFFVISIGPICWVYCGEILTGKLMSITTGVNWFFAFVVVLVFPFMISGLGLALTFWIFAGLNALAAFYFQVDMLETKGKSKLEIREMFEKNK